MDKPGRDNTHVVAEMEPNSLQSRSGFRANDGYDKPDEKYNEE